MKKLILLSLVAFYIFKVNAQCVIEPFSMQKRVYLSDMIVEAEVTDQRCLWDIHSKNIYTIHTLKVYKVFDGNFNGEEIQLVTMGGRVGLEMLVMEPSLQLQNEEFGLFLLKERKDYNKLLGISNLKLYAPSASVQSFVKYDPINLTAHSYFKTYDGIELLLDEVKSYTQKEIVEIQTPEWENPIIKPIATPILTAWSTDTGTAGTELVLTLTGSNFGITRGAGKVEFLDANFGDGRYFKPGYGSSYKSWSNSKIEVYVPSRAGTGKIRITNKNGESLTTSVDFFIKYSHLNTAYWATGIDSAYHMIDHVNDNGNGGYSWNIDKKFRAHEDAVNSFMRSIETWRCGTLMNWDIGADTKVDDYAKDGINIVRFTKFTDSKLGVCGSRYSGCIQGSTLYWHLNEMDIEFDSSRNWYYGTGNPKNNQYDFQTVCTHELGHGHQLGHVNDDNKIMHYSLSNGDRRVDLHAYDVEGGEFVRDKSKVSNACGPSRVVPIQLGNCNITKPKADFTMSVASVCPDVNVKYTDKSEGTVKSYKWDFGSDASLSSATGTGPYNVYYTNAGDKTVSLIVSNDFGSDTTTKMLTVLPPPPATPSAFAFEDSVCTGISTYSIDTVERATEYLWEIETGGNIESSAKEKSVQVDWVIAGGPYAINVRAVNSCGSSDSVEAEVHVTTSAKATFDEDIQGREVNFTFTGEGADEYSWNFGDGNTSTEKDPSNTFPEADDYDVQLIVSNHCSADTLTKEITTEFGTGIEDNFANSWKVYPNPASDVLYIETSIDKGDLRIYSADGRLVRQSSINGWAKIEFSLDGLEAGLYFVELQGEEIRSKKDFVKH